MADTDRAARYKALLAEKHRTLYDVLRPAIDGLLDEALHHHRAGNYREWAVRLNATRLLPFDIDPDDPPEPA